MEVFKVRNSEGLYWEGHSRYKFTKHGKSWRQIGHVRSAFTNAKVGTYDENYRIKVATLPDYLKACEIVKFELKEIETIKI